ncbi:hypothetical protein [Marinimicrobium alkaliphilum]|uniref:hypothetical protein n=1 Tax=Marinimicrobium alkaliphilum TaxID=2202654 RepID=UPI000DBA8CD3|nr:hypothetical protein [Marinimicrobium alkaliphilum]
MGSYFLSLFFIAAAIAGLRYTTNLCKTRKYTVLKSFALGAVYGAFFSVILFGLNVLGAVGTESPSAKLVILISAGMIVISSLDSGFERAIDIWRKSGEI